MEKTRYPFALFSFLQTENRFFEAPSSYTWTAGSHIVFVHCGSVPDSVTIISKVAIGITSLGNSYHSPAVHGAPPVAGTHMPHLQGLTRSDLPRAIPRLGTIANTGGHQDPQLLADSGYAFNPSSTLPSIYSNHTDCRFKMIDFSPWYFHVKIGKEGSKLLRSQQQSCRWS